MSRTNATGRTLTTPDTEEARMRNSQKNPAELRRLAEQSRQRAAQATSDRERDAHLRAAAELEAMAAEQE